MQQPCQDYNDSCASIICQSVDVVLPISLTPEVNVGSIKIKCCKEPTVICRQTACGTHRFELVVTQTLSYSIPIEYSMESIVSDASCK